MPTLLQINSTANWGSTGKIAEQIGAIAVSHGWDSYIAYGRYANPSKSKIIKVGSKISQFLHLITSRVLDNHGLASRIATKAFIKKIKKLSPDIIHLHNIHGYYLNYKILFEYLNTTKIPVVWTLHDCWPFTGHCSHYVHDNCCQWQQVCTRKDCCKVYPTSFLSRTKRNFNLKRRLFTSLGSRLVMTPVSSWLADQTKQSFLGKHRINFIYNGVDTSVFVPRDTSEIKRKFKLDGKKILIGVASTWSEGKGFSDYIELRKRLSDDYIIVMVGVNSAQIANLPDGIVGIKRTQSTQELAELYSASDIVLSLSRAETFGLTVAEGMACGTPAVVYNNTAVPELITEDTGIVVNKTGDIDGVIIAVEQILDRGKQSYTEACRKRAEEHFDNRKCFEKYIRLYDELLA